MRTDTRLAVLAALGCGALGAMPSPSAAAQASTWSGSYAADGACHCAGRIPAGIAGLEVATPSGARTVERVCEAVGSGPGLQFDGEAWSRTVYPDAQCGNGPFAKGVELIDAECAGTRRPGEADCRPVGPRWDLEAAFADDAVPAADSRVAVSRDEPAAAAEAAAGPTAPAPPTAEFIEIDGRSWRRAPTGTIAAGGRPGSRIILDGEVWLAADDPRFAELDGGAEPDRRTTRRADVARAAAASVPSVPAKADAPPSPDRAVAPVRAARSTDASGRVWREAPVEPATGSPEALRARQRELVARERVREAAREADGEAAALAAADASARDDEATAAAPDEPVVLAAALPPTPLVGALEGAADVDADDASDMDDAADAVDAADPAVAEAADAVTATPPGESGAADTAAPLAALRLPENVRGSSAEYGYLEAMPMTYEIGGAGLGLEASGEAAERFHFYGRVGAAESYREVAVGAGVHITPPDADRLSFALTGGVEYGVFDLVGVDGDGDVEIRAEDGEAGLFLTLSSRLVINPRFELAGGVGYSSFHDGDPHGFGGAFFHINRRFDLMSRFEVGDNDQLGIGLRLYY